MAKQEQVDAKVASVLSSSRLAFNVGEKDRVAEGDRVFVMRIERVTDPDSKETLGFVNLVHLRLAVSEVQERFCVADVTELADGEEESVFTALQAFRPSRRKRIARRGHPDDDDPDAVPVHVGQQAIIILRVRKPGEKAGD